MFHSYVEVLKLKRKVGQHLLSEWLQGLDIPDDWKQKIKSCFGSYQNVRKMFSPYPGLEADTAWLLSCPSAVSAIAEFLEAILFGEEHDGRYKDAVKGKHDVQDFLAYASVASAMQDVEALVRQNVKPGVSAETVKGAEEKLPNKTKEEDKDRQAEDEAASASEAATASAVATKLAALSEPDQVVWKNHMRKVLHQHVRFVPDHRSSADLEETLK